MPHAKAAAVAWAAATAVDLFGVFTKGQRVKARPIAIGTSLRRLINEVQVASLREPLRDQMFPVQIAVGTPSGAGILVTAVWEAWQAHPNHVCMGLDIANCHNAGEREKILQNVANNPDSRCASLVQALWAQRRHASGVLIDGLQSLCGQRGGHQGDPLMNPGMALALLPHAKWLQAQLRLRRDSLWLSRTITGHSETRRFCLTRRQVKVCFSVSPIGRDRSRSVDEPSKFVVGVSDMVHDAPLRHSLDANGLPWAMPLSGVVINNAFHLGIVVSGVPIGDTQFARYKLGEVVQRLVSDNDDLVNTLQNVAPQHLSGIQHYCCDCQFDHWLQCCHPADVHATVKPLQDSLDTRFVAGSGFPATFMSDPVHELTVKRLRLPAKASGGFQRFG